MEQRSLLTETKRRTHFGILCTRTFNPDRKLAVMTEVHEFTSVPPGKNTLTVLENRPRLFLHFSRLTAHNHRAVSYSTLR